MWDAESARQRLGCFNGLLHGSGELVAEGKFGEQRGWP